MPEYRKKLIEVALPLEAINKESAREKNIHRGHPSTLHLWWSRKPLATARAVLFAQIVDDPSSLPEEYPTEEAQEVERRRLFRIIEELVKWENRTNEVVLHAARAEIARTAARTNGISLPHGMTPAEVTDALKRYAPPILDPFAGGGSIPLEAQRLGLETYANDLNPVAALINKALIELPPKFASRLPVNPESRKKYLTREWKGAEGMAEDVRYYGKWMRDEAWKRIGHLYPKVRLPKEYGGGEGTAIAWLWARTVKCPNPACGAMIPLASKWWLSNKKGRETFIEPVVNPISKSVKFVVREGKTAPEATVNRAIARCLSCGARSPAAYVRSEADAKRMDALLTALVVDGGRSRGRIYLSPIEETTGVTRLVESYLQQHKVGKDGTMPPVPDEPCRGTFASNAQGARYGFITFGDYFTSRQLVALTTFSELVHEAHQCITTDSNGDTVYADAIATYLALTLDKCVDFWSSLCSWHAGRDSIRNTFARQGLAMTWDFAECNPFSDSTGNFGGAVEWVAEDIEQLPASVPGIVNQSDAASNSGPIVGSIISTDPPYYDNVAYADLSDFFYVWLRRSIGANYPQLFGTMLTPKSQELIATPYRFDGSKERAKHFFENGLAVSFSHIRMKQEPRYPMTVYYAFKQAESDDNQSLMAAEHASTGWETMLEGLLRAEYSISGTWPIRTEMANRSGGLDVNALASSIVLVCRPRLADASLTTRRDFLNALKRELPRALKDLQRGNIAPVDLAQAAIGPGMAVFSRYSKVLESDGTPMRIRTALHLINQTLDEVLAEQEGEYDADTRWAVAWFEQYGMDEGPYGVAETLSKAKNTAVGALVEAGILRAQGGKVRLLRRDEFSSDWNPATAKRLTVWEVTQRLIQALQEQGDVGAAAILDHVGAYGEVARDLAYRLYTICERKKWADEALAYNSLVVEWSDISGAVERRRRTTAEQAPLFS